MYKHILVPTDGSARSERAIRSAVELARSVGARVTFFHNVPKYRALAFEDGLLALDADRYVRDALARASTYLNYARRVAQAAGVECEVATELEGGAHHDEIVRQAEHAHCDLILMATHARRGVEGLLLGSETQRVLLSSTIPVLVLR